jgi:hypothetical protein
MLKAFEFAVNRLGFAVGRGRRRAASFSAPYHIPPKKATGNATTRINAARGNASDHLLLNRIAPAARPANIRISRANATRESGELSVPRSTLMIRSAPQAANAPTPTHKQILIAFSNTTVLDIDPFLTRTANRPQPLHVLRVRDA